jgi:hypothetical protein
MLVSKDLNTFNGFALYFDFNALGRIIEIQHIEFPYVRLGSKNLAGITSNVKVFNNWEEDTEKYKSYKGIVPQEYQLFNPKQARASAMKGDSGQVLYWTPNMFCYPESTFDAVRDAVQTDYEIQIFSLKNIQNGFLGTSIIKAPGGFDSEEDKRKFVNKVKELQGSYNSNSTIVAEWPEDFTGNFIESIPAANNDNLFTNTSEKVTNTILQNFGVPGPILAVSPSGSVFTQEQIRDSYILMNLRTSNKRKMLERVFDPIGKLFGVRLGTIEPTEWMIPGMVQVPGMDTKQEEEKEEPEEKEQEAKLRSIYG